VNNQVTTDQIADFFKQRQIELKDQQAQKIVQYLVLLKNENQRINLTRITENEHILEEHFFDSLAGLTAGEYFIGDNLVDTGTGAGFPGLPIKLLYPELQLTLLEAAGKKAAFLRLLVRELKLDGVQVIQQRSEDFGQNEGREAFNWAVARALASLATGLELVLPLVKIGGFFWAYKGQEYREELQAAEKALQKCGGKLENIIPYTLHQGTVQRHILVFKKIQATDSSLPRRSGVPHKRPIL